MSDEMRMTPKDRAALREAARAQAGDGVMVHAWTGAGHTLQMISTTSESTAAVLALLDECERMREALRLSLHAWRTTGVSNGAIREAQQAARAALEASR